MHRLTVHPDTPAASVRNVDVLITSGFPGQLWLEFYAYSDGTILLPGPKDPERADGLWKTTCFELFVRVCDEPGYLEFNFSPSSDWAAYAFDAYRKGMRVLPIEDPEIWISPNSSHFTLAVEALPNLPSSMLHVALSAVIEETDGTKSYWALRHPPGAPDFHHPDCFALTLEAPPPA